MRIALYSDRRPLPFVYRYDALRADEQHATRPRPHPVPLDAGDLAYFYVTKVRCEYGSNGTAAQMRISLPAIKTQLNVTLPTGGSALGVGALTYCSHFDPGDKIDVSLIRRIPLVCVSEDPGVSASEIEQHDHKCEAAEKAIAERN